MQQTIKLSQLSNYRDNATEVSRNGDDYLVVRLSTDRVETALPEAFKIDCFSFFLCLSGTATLRMNFMPVELRPGTILALNPDNLIELGDNSIAEGVEIYAIFMSPDFLSRVNFDGSAMNFNDVKLESPHSLQLDAGHLRLMKRFFDLLAASAAANAENNVYTRNVSRSLVSAIIYQMMNLASRQNHAEHDETQGRPGRRNYYVRDFMALVKTHFRNERSVKFYADKMFISAKYLSLIIKDSTGFTATQWIDRFVTLEAKNLLRFSGRDIQQIAYDLNFKNQSSFGKYFKHQTGMSPSEFRKS